VSAAVRDADPADLVAIARVAAELGQSGEWCAADPKYVRHLMAVGRFVVLEDADGIRGYAATRPLAGNDLQISMLADLFVSPAVHGQGCGRLLLDRLWADEPVRMTFSSLHPHAVSLYTKFGLDAWWPLLYLVGDPRRVPVPAGYRVEAAEPAAVARLEQQWTGVDRVSDHEAWAARPGGRSFVVLGVGAAPAAAGTAAGAGADFGVVHLAVPPGDDDVVARNGALAALNCMFVPGETVRVCLPAPHPATRPLLAAGWRYEEFDLFMASQPGLLDPRRAVPSPALA
jgi:GNAT superfamily N-acetyltransferase